MTNRNALVELAEREMFDSIVHGLRSRGWSRMDAEAEAIERIVRARSQEPSNQMEGNG